MVTIQSWWDGLWVVCQDGAKVSAPMSHGKALVEAARLRCALGLEESA